MKLRPIKALDLPDLQPGPVDMARPRYMDVDPTTLFVDEAYQRNLSDRSRQLIRKIVATWDWRAFKPPVVVETDKGLHVIDGQHTAISAASHPAIRSIPVQIVEAADAALRAGAFVKHNRDRIAITPSQMHFAMVAAGDEDALTIEQVCDRAGATILKYPPQNGVYAPGDVIALSTLRALVSRRHAAGARRVLDVCVAAKLAPISQAAMRAVEFLLNEPEYAGSVAPNDLADTLRTMGADAERQAKLHAVEHRVPTWRGLAIVLFRNTRKIRRAKQDEPQSASTPIRAAAPAAPASRVFGTSLPGRPGR